MAAAPVLTASFEDSLRPPNKRLRRANDDGGGGRTPSMGEDEAPIEPTSVCPISFRKNLEALRNVYPTVSEGLLSSLLESSGNLLEPTAMVLDRIVSASGSTRPGGRVIKRRRPSTESSEAATAPAALEPADMISAWVTAVIRRLQGVSTQEEAFAVIRPAVDELLAKRKATTQAILPTALQKLMSKAIVQQAEKISALKESMDHRETQLDRLQRRVVELEQQCQGLDCANQKLKEANGALSYYIKAALASNQHCAPFFSDGSGPGSGSIPDVY